MEPQKKDAPVKNLISVNFWNHMLGLEQTVIAVGSYNIAVLTKHTTLSVTIKTVCLCAARQKKCFYLFL